MALWLTGLACVASFLTTFTLSSDDTRNIATIVTLVFFAAFFVISVFREFVCLCPTCKHPLFTSFFQKKEGEHITFDCQRCDVKWDVGITARAGADN